MVDSSALDPGSISVEDGEEEVVQLDGGYDTPTDLNFSSLFFSQVDGAGDEIEAKLIKSEPRQEEESDQEDGSHDAESAQAADADGPAVLIYKSEVEGPIEFVEADADPMETSEDESQENEGRRPLQHVRALLTASGTPRNLNDFGSCVFLT